MSSYYTKAQVTQAFASKVDLDDLPFSDEAFSPEAIAARATEAETKASAQIELADWLSQQIWSNFAVSLAEQFTKTGKLSEKQWASAESMRAKVTANQQRKAAEVKAPALDTGIDLAELPSGHYAVPGGDTRLKIRVRHVTSGKWEGFTFVDDGAAYGQGTNYGRQAPGGSYQGKVQDQLRAILADPQAAIKAYGDLTGNCGICNRQLEDEQSVARGIGPICAGKIGW